VSTPGRLLRRALDEGPLLVPFVFDGLQARLAEQAGFAAVYLSGFGCAAARGRPDLGLLTMSEMLDGVRAVAGSVGIPAICDADTGFGDVLNVQRAVEEFERAGEAALQIEDQVWPKRCGFMAGKEVVSEREMLAKLRAACDARRAADFLIVARTDALAPLGWDEAERRARAYCDAGADLIFVGGVADAAALDEYLRRLGDLPIAYNGRLGEPRELHARGVRLQIHGGVLAVLFRAVQRAMRELRETGALREVPPDGNPLGEETMAEWLRLFGAEEMLRRGEGYGA